MKHRRLFNECTMNLNDFGIRARITAGLALILFLAVLSTGMSLKNNTSVRFESGEVSGSWIPAIDNLGHMKGFVADHYLAVSDRMAGRDQSDAASFGKRIQTIESDLAKATEVYAATLLTYTEESAAQGNAPDDQHPHHNIGGRCNGERCENGKPHAHHAIDISGPR